jgi:hypothetical protein
VLRSATVETSPTPVPNVMVCAVPPLTATEIDEVPETPPAAVTRSSRLVEL